ncbi:MAG: pyridoxamine 5'-phosphate oxidase family protein [Pseudomonadales bacterium]|nr:pyridoxamine 5'-phosphate oxidase family protein [Pseudomonadales bacterium]
MTDPINIFNENWNKSKSLQDPNAQFCFLATATNNQGASLRTLVLREVKDDKFLIFINSTSPKWHELESSEHCELLVFWPTLMQQYRIRGRYNPVPEEFMRACWNDKPYASKLIDHFYFRHQGQSSTIPSREVLTQAIEELKLKYPKNAEVPFVPSAKGVEVVPTSIEVWIGVDEDRLHDRALYTKSGSGWDKKILVP